MAGVKSIVRINKGKLRKLTQAQITALEKTAEALHSEIVQAQVVPRMDGALQGEQFFVDCSGSSSGTVSLVHATPYARRLYYHPEYQFHREAWEDGAGRRHDGNPNARGKWFEPWISGEYKGFVIKTFKEYYRREAGL